MAGLVLAQAAGGRHLARVMSQVTFPRGGLRRFTFAGPLVVLSSSRKVNDKGLTTCTKRLGHPRAHADEVDVDDLFFSTTDGKGIIEQANSVFVRMSRFPWSSSSGHPTTSSATR